MQSIGMRVIQHRELSDGRLQVHFNQTPAARMFCAIARDLGYNVQVGLSNGQWVDVMPDPQPDWQKLEDW